MVLEFISEKHEEEKQRGVGMSVQEVEVVIK